MSAPSFRCVVCQAPGRPAQRWCADCRQPVHQRCQAAHACALKQARLAALEDATRARLLTYRAILTLQVDSALGSPAAWDWPGRLGLRPPEGVVVEVERPRKEAGRNRGASEVGAVTRLSGDELRNGFVWNGFDYALQVWVVDGVVQRCGHPPAMASRGPCCAALVLAGRRIDETPGAQRRGVAADTTAASGVTDPAARPTEA